MPDDFFTPVHRSEEEIAERPPVIFGNGHADPKLSSTPRVEALQHGIQTDNTNKNFKGQQKNEIVYSFCRKHWIVLLPYFLWSGLFTLLIIGSFLFVSSADLSALFGQLTYRIVAGIAIAALILYFHYAFNRFFNYYLQILIITNFRVIQLDQTLFFTRNRDSIDLPEIQDIVIQQKGIFQTILNYGSLIITLSSAHSTKHIYCIPNPEYHFRKINNTKREYITTRRLDKGKGA